MVKNNTDAEHNLDKNSDFEGYNNEDMGDNESIVPGSDLDTSDIEVSSVGSSEILTDHVDFGDEKDDSGPNTVNEATVTITVNIPNWTTNFNDITTGPFFQDSGPSLPEQFDVSVATALDYFNLMLKLEIFSNIRDHTNC